MSEQNVSPATPWHLWVLGGLLFLFNGFGVFDYIATLIRYEPHLAKFPAEALEYYYNAPTWMFVMWGASTIGGFVGAIFMLLRSKLAIPVFIIGWVSSLVTAIYTLNNPPPGDGPGVVMYLVVLGVALLVILYLFWMSRRGVLR